MITPLFLILCESGFGDVLIWVDWLKFGRFGHKYRVSNSLSGVGAWNLRAMNTLSFRAFRVLVDCGDLFVGTYRHFTKRFLATARSHCLGDFDV